MAYGNDYSSFDNNNRASKINSEQVNHGRMRNVPKPPKVGPAEQGNASKRSKIPLKLGNKVKKSGNPRASENWGIKGIAMLLVICIMSSLTLGNLNKSNFFDLFRESGIVASEETTITGLSLSRLLEKQFSVSNKSKRDSSADTVWTLNDVPIGSGSNTVYLKQELLKWGDNYLNARNGEDLVSYRITLEKGDVADDPLHTMLSNLVEYGDGWFEYGEVYSQVDSGTMLDLASQKYDFINYNDGTFKTSQEYQDELITLETTESEVYSLSLGKPQSMPEKFAGEYAVQVEGNWDNVKSATLSFDLKGTSKDNWIAVMYKNNKVVAIPSDNQFYSNGRLIIDLKQPGIYLLRPSNLESGNLKIQYDIAILDLDETDVISNNSLKADPTLGPSDPANQLDTEFYTEFLNNLIDDADSRTKVELSVGLLTWGNKTAMLDKDGTKFIRDYTNSSVQEALLSMYDLDLNNMYSKIGLMLFDASGLSEAKLTELGNVLLDASQSIAYNMTFVVAGAKTSISKLIDIPDSMVLIELDTLNEAKSIIPTLNSALAIGDTTVLYKDTDKEVTVVGVADSLFDQNTFGVTCTTKINDLTGMNNSYGMALASKLMSRGLLDYNLVKSNNCLREAVQIPDGFNVSEPTTGVIVNGEDMSDIDDETMTSIVNMLDLSQFNYNGGMFHDISKFKQNGGYSYFIEYLANRIHLEGPVIGLVGCQYGYQSILITGIYQNKDNPSEYYLSLYNPSKAGIDSLAKLSFYRGVSTSNSIGYGYSFEYEVDGVIFDKLSLVDKISIFSDDIEVLSFGEG